MRSFKQRWYIMSTLILLTSLLILGCDVKEETEVAAEENNITEESLPAKDKQPVHEKSKEITTYDGKPSPVLDQVYTTDKTMALTFNGIIEENKMHELLKKLALFEIRATFFLDQNQIKENIDVVKTLVEKGHAIENSVFDQQDLNDFDYKDIHKEVHSNNEFIEEITGKQPTFTRTKPRKKNENLQLITAQLDMEAVVDHSIRPRDKDLEDTDLLAEYFEHALSRGGVISLDVEDYPFILDSIDYIIHEANQLDYSIIPLTSLVVNNPERKPFTEIDGYDLVTKNLNYEHEKPNEFYQKDTNEKVVALTFDDYGSDKTVMEILDVLEENEIQSSFFIKAKDVTRNPNLAKVILDEGHEIANHSYSHMRSTELTPEELQEDLIKAHRIITEAIQEKPTMLFRPPFGNIDQESAKIMSAVGFNDIAMYDVSSYDWNAEYTVYDVLERTMDGVEPGSVIVMHMLDNIHNLDALPIIIEKLKAEGYSFVKMSEWFEE